MRKLGIDFDLSQIGRALLDYQNDYDFYGL
jgi:hypothetical protein